MNSKDKTIPVSVIVMTKNEERNVKKCLDSVSSFDEVFVVDSYSIDRTCEIERGMGAKVVEFKWNGKYPKKKQWCLENLPFSHDWVLYLDADEELYQETCAEIRSVITDGPRHAGYFAGYDYVFSGKVLKYGHLIYKLILLDRFRSRFADYDDLKAANMWEVEGHYQPVVDGTTGILKNRMLHNDHDTLFDYFQRHNRYSDWEAVVWTNGALSKSREAQPVVRAFLKRAFRAVPFRGLVAFVHSYFLKLGFLDGRAGFHFAVARGFYYWQTGLKIRELRDREN